MRAEPEGGHWVTIDNRDVLIDGEQTARVREGISATAKKYKGSAAWAFSKREDDFPAYSNKCNKYVYDITKEAGAEATVIGSDGKARPPLAGEWADPNVVIQGWPALGPREVPQAGDVAAYKLVHLPGDAPYTGHSGIVTGVDADGTVHAMAAHEDVVGSDDSFNSSRARKVTYRRYEGGH